MQDISKWKLVTKYNEDQHNTGTNAPVIHISNIFDSSYKMPPIPEGKIARYIHIPEANQRSYLLLFMDEQPSESELRDLFFRVSFFRFERHNLEQFVICADHIYYYLLQLYESGANKTITVPCGILDTYFNQIDLSIDVDVDLNYLFDCEAPIMRLIDIIRYAFINHVSDKMNDESTKLAQAYMSNTLPSEYLLTEDNLNNEK